MFLTEHLQKDKFLLDFRQWLIKGNVIKPEVTPTEWCAPAFFVLKGDGLRVRLVTDYTKLN